MKVLVTGASGFLGKRVLAQLVAHPDILRIDVIARNKLSHPSPKVKIIPCDLMQPAVVANVTIDADAVIHLAGLYDFTKAFHANYLQNVLGTLNLLQRVQDAAAQRSISIHYASTYAVSKQPDALNVCDEEPIATIPDVGIPYAHTKALAEQAVLLCGLPGAVFRLGILVGDSQEGLLEKADGVYYVLQALRALGNTMLGRRLRHVPVLAHEDGVLPLVPVDAAARVFVTSLFKDHAQPDRTAAPRIYGVFQRSSVRIDTFCREVLARYVPRARPVYIHRAPRTLLESQSWLTKIPSSVWEFALSPHSLLNENFEATFNNCRIPAFDSYRSAFYRGFEDYMGGAEA